MDEPKPVEKTFVIPTVTNIDGALKTVETIHKYCDNFRIILIDNSEGGHYDKFKDLVHGYFHPYYNLGFAKSCNVGMLLAKSTLCDYVVLCNDDVEFIHKDWWKNAIAHFKADEIKGGKPIAGVQIASIMDRGAEIRIPHKDEYTQEDWDTLIEWKDTTGVYGNAKLKDIVTEGGCMWCTIIPMPVLDRVGMFDEKFYPGGGEDYDFCRRVYMKGYRLIQVYDSWAFHWWGQTKDKFKQWDGLPMKKELIWNDFPGKWASKPGDKEATIYGDKGRQIAYPLDDKRIIPL